MTETVTAAAATVEAPVAAVPTTVTILTLSVQTETVPATTKTVIAAETAAESESAPLDADDGHNMKVGTPLPITQTSRLDSNELGTGEVTLLKVVSSDKCTESYCSVKDGKRIYSIQVMYEGKTGALPYNPFNWSLVDDEGQQYSDHSYHEVALGQRLDSGDVGAGRKVKGVIAFEIPAKVKIVLVDFENIGDWKVG